jgi:hypothetical protein
MLYAQPDEEPEVTLTPEQKYINAVQADLTVLRELAFPMGSAKSFVRRLVDGDLLLTAQQWNRLGNTLIHLLELEPA